MLLLPCKISRTTDFIGFLKFGLLNLGCGFSYHSVGVAYHLVFRVYCLFNLLLFNNLCAGEEVKHHILM